MAKIYTTDDFEGIALKPKHQTGSERKKILSADSNDNERQEATTTSFNKAVLLLKRTHTNLELQNNPNKMPPSPIVTRVVFSFIILSNSADCYMPICLKQGYSLVSPFPNKNFLSNQSPT